MAFVIATAVLFLDQATKFLACRYLDLRQSLPLLKGILYLSLVRNRGAAFGILKGQNLFFILVAAFTVVLIFLELKKIGWRKVNLGVWGLSLVLAGALGNLIDRVVFGYVIDFIDLRIWPVFNVADSAITIGAALWVFSALRGSK